MQQLYRALLNFQVAWTQYHRTLRIDLIMVVRPVLRKVLKLIKQLNRPNMQQRISNVTLLYCVPDEPMTLQETGSRKVHRRTDHMTTTRKQPVNISY